MCLLQQCDFIQFWKRCKNFQRCESPSGQRGVSGCGRASGTWACPQDQGIRQVVVDMGWQTWVMLHILTYLSALHRCLTYLCALVNASHKLYCTYSHTFATVLLVTYNAAQHTVICTFAIMCVQCFFLVFPLTVLCNIFLQVKQRQQFGECQERILKRRHLHPNIEDLNEGNCVLKDHFQSLLCF